MKITSEMLRAEAARIQSLIEVAVEGAPEDYLMMGLHQCADALDKIKARNRTQGSTYVLPGSFQLEVSE